MAHAQVDWVVDAWCVACVAEASQRHSERSRVRAATERAWVSECKRKR